VELMNVAEAAQRLGVSTDTIKRRLKRGELQGQRQDTPQGFIWLVAIPKSPDKVNGAVDSSSDAMATESHTTASAMADAMAKEVRRLEEMVEMLQKELDHRAQEMERMQILLQQALDPTRAIAAPRQLPWWRRVWRKD
jgi:IS30 family transposase